MIKQDYAANGTPAPSGGIRIVPPMGHSRTADHDGEKSPHSNSRSHGTLPCSRPRRWRGIPPERLIGRLHPQEYHGRNPNSLERLESEAQSPGTAFPECHSPVHVQIAPQMPCPIPCSPERPESEAISPFFPNREFSSCLAGKQTFLFPARTRNRFIFRAGASPRIGERSPRVGVWEFAG